MPSLEAARWVFNTVYGRVEARQTLALAEAEKQGFWAVSRQPGGTTDCGGRVTSPAQNAGSPRRNARWRQYTPVAFATKFRFAVLQMADGSLEVSHIRR